MKADFPLYTKKIIHSIRFTNVRCKISGKVKLWTNIKMEEQSRSIKKQLNKEADNQEKELHEGADELYEHYNFIVDKGSPYCG